MFLKNLWLKESVHVWVLFLVFWALMLVLHNNQINAGALIGQSAMGYYAGKPMEKKTARLLNYYIKAMDHKFLWVIGW